jgi:hypothetical protein
METKPTIETVMEYLKAMDGRIIGMEARMNGRFDRIEEQLKLLSRKLDILNKANLDHEARIEELEEVTTELTRPLPKNRV